jgi:putative hemolysin
MTVDDFNETVGTRLPQDSARTLAGLVFNTLGRRPQPGDGARLAVETIDGVRIERLRIELPAASAPA